MTTNSDVQPPLTFGIDTNCTGPHRPDTPAVHLSDHDRRLLALALRALRADLERKADRTEDKLDLPITDPNFVVDGRREALAAAVRRNDADIESINSLYTRLGLPEPSTHLSDRLKDPSKVAGANARAKALTPEQRSEIARQGAAARWHGVNQ